jgi:dethiobiotin synthetase
MKRLFITGNGTDVGKTFIAAMLTEAWQADYWKPIQAGELENTDTMKVRAMVSNKRSKFHPESYKLTQAMSPHAAAARDGVTISMANIQLPITDNTLLIEGAGGLFVPINDSELMVDLIGHLGAETILVSRNYLGSINHTLLTVEALKHRNLKIAGIIFNDTTNLDSENYIINYTGLRNLGRVDKQAREDKDHVSGLARQFAGLLESL